MGTTAAKRKNVDPVKTACTDFSSAILMNTEQV